MAKHCSDIHFTGVGIQARRGQVPYQVHPDRKWPRGRLERHTFLTAAPWGLQNKDSVLWQPLARQAGLVRDIGGQRGRGEQHKIQSQRQLSGSIPSPVGCTYTWSLVVLTCKMG